MNLTAARSFVRNFARHAGDSTSYSDTRIDQAIQSVCNRFCRVTQAIKSSATLALTASSSALPTLPTGFRPDQLLRAWIGGKPPLSPVDMMAIIARQAVDNSTTVSGVPRLLAFSSWTAGVVYPVPDVAYTLNFLWWSAFTTWTPGGADPVVLNIPDDMLVEAILPLGVPARLQFTDPEHLYTSQGWKDYLAWEAGMKGVGNLGARVIDRVLPL